MMFRAVKDRLGALAPKESKASKAYRVSKDCLALP
jgi:hypothetical protein